VFCCVRLFGEPLSVSYSPVFLSTGVDGSGTLLLRYPGMTATLLLSKQSHSFAASEVQGEAATLLIDSLSEFAAVRHSDSP
jgi:hypothetical protein